MFSKGLLVIFSGPSGTGKGTVLKLVRDKNSNVKFSVSATTRNPREGEVDGQNYFFMSVEEFKSMIDNDRLLEWVEYCGNYYGTPRTYVEENIAAGFDVILEIEVEGALKIMDRYPECVSIFILPPSFEELRKRIEGRGTENRDVIEKRLEKAKKEINFIGKYDYVVINDDIIKAADDIISILRSEKLKFERNKNILEKMGIENWRDDYDND